MNWYTLGKEFKEKFPDYSVIVNPPCISTTRETEYVYRAYAHALNKIENDHVIINHEHTTVLYYR